jgi:hypothetical protein
MVNVAGNLANHWRYVSDPRAVQLLSAGPTGYAAPVDIANALRRAISKDDVLAFPALLNTQAVVWHLWLAQLGVARPKTHDVIVDESGVRWQVVSVKIMDEGQRFRCVCQKEK